MSIDRTPRRIVAVVVSFHPQPAPLVNLIDRLAPQVHGIVVVDNGSSCDVARPLADSGPGRARVLALGENRGVAAGLNVGIGHARASGATHVVLFDQDSEPAPDMVARLCEGLDQAEAQGRRVAAVGPRFVDPRTGNAAPFIRVRGLRIERIRCAAEPLVAADYLISSGCLLPMTAIDEVGPMNADLFIDYVDVEWGLRARRAGFHCLGVCAAAMRHPIGEAPIVFLGTHYPNHSPLRHYYHFRNALWLATRNWVPANWRIVDIYRLVLKYGFYGLFGSPRLAHLRMMSRGLADGLRGRLGRYAERPA